MKTKERRKRGKEGKERKETSYKYETKRQEKERRKWKGTMKARERKCLVDRGRDSSGRGGA